ncbi:MAG: hypothetical protein IKI75_04810 [Lachnospiraceae bacterium]|nr:hypothetical protein [Lachnospiraceae bacterium]
MSALTTQTINLVQMLPEDELVTINSLLKMLVRSWDPDFTKLTEEERRQLEQIEQEMDNGEYYSEDDVWD